MSNKINEALFNAKQVQYAILENDAAKKLAEDTLRERQKNVDERKKLIEASCNKSLIEHAATVLRSLFKNIQVSEHVEKSIQSDGFVSVGEKMIFIPLAESPINDDQPASYSPEFIRCGKSFSRKSFQLSLCVNRGPKKGYEWNTCSLKYYFYSVDNIDCDGWLDATPINLDPSMLRTLLYLQTPETAIQILVEQFNESLKKKVGCKDRIIIPRSVMKALTAGIHQPKAKA